jgi:signal transduction histidine kinase
MAAIDAKGEIWVGGQDALARWNGARLIKVASLSPRKVSITAARDGGLWLAAGRALWRYTTEKGFVHVAELGPLHPRTRIATLMEDSAGRVWCGTFNAGLHCWDGKAFEKVSVAHHDVWALYEDAEHNVWVGTGGNGLVRVRRRVLTTLDEPNGPVGQTPRSLCVDANQNVWVATQTGDLYQRAAAGWRQWDLYRDLKTLGVTCVVADAKGTVWAGCTEDKVSRWDGAKFLDDRLPERRWGPGRIVSMLVARDDTLWVGRGDEVLHRTPTGWKVFTAGANRAAISVLAQDRVGDVWAGTIAGHLLRVHGAGLVHQEGGHRDEAVRCLLPTPDGALWVGRTQRLERLKERRWSEVTAAHGLTGGALSQLTLDDRERVWLGVDQGVLVARLKDLNEAADGLVERIHFSPYTTGGIQASPGFTPNSALMKGGWLWYCSRTGVVTADLNAAGSNSVAPKVSIESVRLGGSEKPAGGSLRFGPRPEHISFELGAMSFRLPDKVRLFHRIEGVDRDWVEVGKDRIAQYPRLPPGQHVLQVRAVNEDGVRSEREAMLAFEVVPSFWEKPFFRLVLVLASMIGAFFAARYFVLRSMRKEAEALREQVAVHGERVRIARDMHDQLGASLTQISLITDLMAGESTGDKRVTQLGRAARQATTALDEIVWAVNPKHDHLGSVLEYLAQQAVNLLEPAGLRCRLDFPEDAPDRHLPAEFRHQVFLIVREAVNNVIKHASAKEVTLAAQVTPDVLHLLITDDGRGGVEQTGGDGLQNMKSRAQALGGECDIRSAPSGGTTVELEVPWPHRPRSS